MITYSLPLRFRLRHAIAAAVVLLQVHLQPVGRERPVVAVRAGEPTLVRLLHVVFQGVGKVRSEAALGALLLPQVRVERGHVEVPRDRAGEGQRAGRALEQRFRHDRWTWKRFADGLE